MRRALLVAWTLGGSLGAISAADGAPPVVIELHVDPAQGTVGDPLAVELVVDVAGDAALERSPLGPMLGPFSVVEESWSGPQKREGRERWTWSGRIVAFRTGELELPAIRLRVLPGAGDPISAETEPRSITIASVLDPNEEAPELAGLKPPASVPPDHRPLLTAAAILLALLLLSLLLWWLHRRYGARLAAVPLPDDPFHRTPPDAWIYAELQKLLARRLAEQGQVDIFFEELARILKMYLGGRFRIELLEQTTTEVPDRLRQSGTPVEWIERIHELLLTCDMVKFAGRVPVVEDCREAIDRAYRIVDGTKPQPVTGAA